MKRRLPRSRVTHDRWLVSYADFITLLFGFFVVLFAFSKADQKKQAEVVASIDSAFKSLGTSSRTSHTPANRHTPGAAPELLGMPINVVMSENLVSPGKVKRDLDETRRRLERNLSSQIGTQAVSIHIGREGLVISLREAGFFASGSATPGVETSTTLREISASLTGTPYDLRIEGHTDSIPIHSSEFNSNWELSTARATTIARLFLDLKTLPPDRVSASGYAGFHPVASNDTEAGRSENRRVDLVLVPRTSIDFSDSGSEQSGINAWRRITDD